VIPSSYGKGRIMSRQEPESVQEDISKSCQWLANKTYVDDHVVYRLSGGDLSDPQGIKDKFSSLLHMSNDQFSDMKIYKRVGEGSWDYWIARNENDVKSAGSIERPEPYYCMKNEKTSLSDYVSNIGLSVFIMATAIVTTVMSVVMSFTTNIAPGLLTLACLISMVIGVLIPLILFTSIFHSRKNILYSDGHVSDDTAITVNGIKGVWKRLRRRFSKHVSKPSSGYGFISIYDDVGSTHKDLSYNLIEVVTYMNALNNPKKFQVIETVRNEPVVSSAQESESDILRKDIIDKLHQRLPNDSNIVKIINDMVLDGKTDASTLAKIEGALENLTNNEVGQQPEDGLQTVHN
jgi:prepilin-type processing-associated H-X9-DG protein